MSIASTTFLFLFLPAVIGVYFLIPADRGMRCRNLLLLLASLVFYAWGDPESVLLLALMVLLVRLLGKAAESGRGSVRGKAAVLLTVALNAGAGFFVVGQSVMTVIPVGFAFFIFHAVSYVVDIYRGQCRSPKHLTDTALYLCVFYKLQQGPVVSFREFGPQLENRKSSVDGIADGIWRLGIGLGKKMIIASNLHPMVTAIFNSSFADLSAADAWIGCVCFFVCLYFDFSGYSDMAIGLGRVFGFRTPENFDFPFASTSVAEYWRRWHITLCAWFRDYLYYPVLLGPSVRLRKFLVRRNVDNGLAKKIQNVFVPSCVWLATALWHGANLNFTLWGLVNCAAIIVEPHIRPLSSRRADKFVRWLGVMLFLLLTVPLIYTPDLGSALLYFKAMFSANAAVSTMVIYCLRSSWPFLMAGIVLCFPQLSAVAPKKHMTGWNIVKAIFLFIVAVVSVAYLFRNGTSVFMYQQ